jgi:hypothetical protein
MVCQRCRGLLVRETFDGLSPEADMMRLSTRCINCGSIEDPVVLANRLRRPAAKRAVPRRMVGMARAVFMKTERIDLIVDARRACTSDS